MDVKSLKLTPKRLEICERLDFSDTKDILSYYPFKYENYTITPLKDFKEGMNVFFEAELLSSPSTFRFRGKMSVTRFRVLYEEEELQVSIFNRPWAKQIPINSTLTIIGKYEGNNKVLATNYYLKPIKELEGIMPFYSLKENITQNEIKKLIEIALEKTELVDELPDYLIEEHKLLDYKEAILNIHKPQSEMLLKQAISRLKYEEFLKFYLALEYLKDNTNTGSKCEKVFKMSDVNRFIDTLPFELTKDQTNTISESLNDLRSKKTMYRLIQGEVGSGKTAVAEVLMYANYLAGYQSALMAPTEILAKQHYESFINQFKDTGIRIGLLYSASDNIKTVKDKLRNGEIDIVIGTHALFQDDVEFKKLGLVIADEQHRFGVKQRRALKEKGKDVDFVLMSATPIPRTLASSIYGDMDISTIASLPLGRKGCVTKLIKKNSIVDVVDELKDKLNEGRQIYIISAAIEKSENYSAKDATGLYNSLKDLFKPYKIALLHGRMSSLEKDEVMKDFKDNKVQVLVSTTVVEVGVNVKNATVMVIYDADKFGLSQLHQLRGRIQRGNHEGTCYLLTSSDDDKVLERLNVLVNTNDGFKISYEDLRLRGPGDILGTRQSGLPVFILGNLIEDTKFIEAARNDAKRIIKGLNEPQNSQYYENIKEDAKKRAMD